MNPYWQFLVSLGTWAQSHQELVLTLSVSVVFLLGATRLPWRTAFRDRRPRL
jgi:hypothetical protein